MPLHVTCNRFACLLLLISWAHIPAGASSFASRSESSPADSIYKSWYYTPTGVFGRLPLDRPRNRTYIRLSHPSANETAIEDFNPAGVVTNITRVYFTGGLISLATETNRWGDTYDSIWFKPDGPDKFIVSERKRGVNPYLPCKYEQYTFKNNLLTDIVCYLDSIRAGSDQQGVAHYVFERYGDPERHGLIKSESFFTEIDVPTYSRSADCHKILNDYNNKGDLVSRSIYDQDDKPASDRAGVFRTRYKYDGDGNETEADYFDKTDRSTATAGGYDKEYLDYHHGLLSEVSYRLDDNSPGVSSTLGSSVSFVDHQYDRDGNETSTTYFDTQHSAVNNIEGFHEIDKTYSVSGMLNKASMIPISGDMVTRGKIYYTLMYNRDNKGRVADQRIESNTGVIFNNREDGAYLTKYGYDDWDRIRSVSYWQNDSTKMVSGPGCHEIIHRYDDDGQLAENDYLDENGAPATAELGYSKMVIRRNEAGLIAESAYFAGDKPVLLDDALASVTHFHRIVCQYDLLNRLRSMLFYDESGLPTTAIVRRNSRIQYSARRVEFDYNGARLVTETLSDSAQNVSTGLDCTKGLCVIADNIVVPTRIKNAVKLANYHGSFHPDTVFGDQLGFIGEDSLIVFVSADRVAQVMDSCSVYYRIAEVNKYYQLDGRVTDYFMDNDSVAATFTYELGKLEGPVYIFYHNGRIKEKGIYQNNLKSGIWEYYYDNGQKERTLQYQNGLPLLLDCYTRTGDVLAQNGNGRFEGIIGATPSPMSHYELLAKGNVKDGLPDGEWDLYMKQIAGPAYVENFSHGKFRHGVSHSLVGQSTYTDRVFSTVEGMHNYEGLDHYTWSAFCHVATAPVMSNLYQEIRNGFGLILRTNKYGAYSGWIFLDVQVSGTGKVLSSYVRLCHPDAAFESDIRSMAADLPYPKSGSHGSIGTPYEKMYILLVEGNQVVIPEEILEAQRNPFR